MICVIYHSSLLLYQLLTNPLLHSPRISSIDDGTPCKGDFVTICTSLDLNYDILTKRNHKKLTVEHFHYFLNKAVTIAIEDRQSNDVFVPAEIAAGYAWNSAPINRTDILRNTIAIGREFRFHININLSALP